MVRRSLLVSGLAASAWLFAGCSPAADPQDPSARSPAVPAGATPDASVQGPPPGSTPDAGPGAPADAAPDAPQTFTTIEPLVSSKADLARSLFPVAVGLKWTYDVKPGTTTCSGRSRTITFRSKSTANGQEYFALDTVCDYFAPGANSVWIVGDAVFSQVATGAPSKSLSPPLVNGAMWAMNSVVTGTWVRELVPVTVAAGTFKDCWTVHSVPYEANVTYCRGVGVVRTSSATGGGGTGFGSELTSYDFGALP